MTALEEYNKMIIGKTLTNLFFTKQNGPHDYMPGIPPAYYFSTIMELDGYKLYRFGNDFINEWKEEEPLLLLTHENWGLSHSVDYKGQKIVAITQDEYQQLTFHLENGTTIAHTIDYGDQLFIENNNIIDQEMSKQFAATNSHLANTDRKWWQILLGLR